jgi:hypothetical protein
LDDPKFQKFLVICQETRLRLKGVLGVLKVHMEQSKVKIEIPSKACWTLRLRFCDLTAAETEAGPLADEGGFVVITYGRAAWAVRPCQLSTLAPLHAYAKRREPVVEPSWAAEHIICRELSITINV